MTDKAAMQALARQRQRQAGAHQAAPYNQCVKTCVHDARFFPVAIVAQRPGIQPMRSFSRKRALPR